MAICTEACCDPVKRRAAQEAKQRQHDLNEQRFYIWLRAQGKRLSDSEVEREDALNAKYGPVKEAIQLAVRA